MSKKKAKKKEETSPAIIDPEGGALAPSDYDAEDLDAGFEGTTADDYQLPLLTLLQKGSPQVDPDDPKYVEGAKPGMILNTVTEEVWEELAFIPVHREHRFVEWIPREDGGGGGGFVGVHSPADPMVQEARRGGSFGKLETPDGNDLVETFSVFGLRVDPAEGVADPCVIPFSSSQIKHYKRWMTRARSIVVRHPETGQKASLPLYAHVYRLATRSEENNKGRWSGWKIGFWGDSAGESRLKPDHPLFVEAKNLRDMVKAGEVTERFEGGADDAADGADATPADPGEF